jgi:hypothetical protein
MYKNEPCESKVANLLQAACESEVPSEKIRLLVLCVAEQEKEVQELRKQLAEHEDFCKNFEYDEE